MSSLKYEDNYYESFIKFWVPIYKRQAFHANFCKDSQYKKLLKDNITKNIHLTDDQKIKIIKELQI